MGGFASGPGGIAAWSMGIPLVLHEQNAVPGVTNKILARFAHKVLTGFDRTFAQQSQQPNKYAWVGNPVRQAFAEIPAKRDVTTPLRVLIVGGSLGAKVLNETVPAALAGYAGRLPGETSNGSRTGCRCHRQISRQWFGQPRLAGE